MKLKKILIKGVRINLRTLENRDIESLTRYGNDKSISRFTTLPYPYRRNNAEEFIKKTHKNHKTKKAYELGIELNREIIGSMSLLNIDYKNKNAELGYWLGKPFRGKGYAAEAARMIIDFGFNKLKLKKIYARADNDNPASASLLKNLGFKDEGIFRKHSFRNGKWYDELRFGLLREEYRK